MNRKSIFAAASVVCVAGALASLNASAQDIEFMGKNGDKIELTLEIEAVPGQPAVVPRKAAPQNAGGFPAGGRKVRLAIGGLPDLKGRTFTVVGPDGETKEISTDNARSVSINRSFSSVTNNGKQEIKQGGTAIIVDADGQRYEIDLSQIEGDQAGDAQGKVIQGKQVEVKKSYMIGVFSEPVPEMVRSQLDLDQGVGLMVKRVQADSPAALAGLKKFDILLYADDQVLTKAKDLTNVVSETGANEQAFTLTVMRGGKEMPIEVAAVEREATAGVMPGFMPVEGFEMRDMGPGLILDREFDNGMMERMRDHMKQVREQMERMDGILENQPMPQFRMQR